MVALTFAACNSAENGKSAYEIAVENGFEGSVEEWLDSLKGKDGKDGADGVNGADGVDGLNGSDGLDGQNGLNGEEGSSAYEIALENGFKGTVEEWLASLKGDTAEAS
ncbi:MAG: collagen-like protein, partial [Clostridia bacterium]|nr:collagen-like protein [Clostridia bacterium]